MGFFGDGSLKYKISIKSLYLDKNEKTKDNKRIEEKVREKVLYACVEPFANARI